MSKLYRMDLIIPGLGRLHPGESWPRRERDRYRDMIRELVRSDNLELVRAYRDGRVTIEELADLRRSGRLGVGLADVKLRRPLFERGPDGELRLGAVLREAMDAMTARPETIRGYQKMWTVAMRSGWVPPDATVRDLVGVRWAAWYREWPHGEAYWRHLRAAISQTMTRLLGKQHPLRLELMALIPHGRPVEREPDLSPRELEQILEHVPDIVRDCFRAILILACRHDEFCRVAPEDLRHDRYEVELVRRGRGKTTEARRTLPVDPELWPVVVRGVNVRATYWQLARWWRRAVDRAGLSRYTTDEKGRRVREAPRIHDLRHALAQWLTDEHVDATALMKYLGHRSLAMTERYQRRKLRRAVATAVRRVIPPVAPLKAV